MRKIAAQPAIALILCLSFSFLPFQPFTVNAEHRLSDATISYATSSLLGEKAIEHLRKNRQYQLLQRAFEHAQQRVNSVQEATTATPFRQNTYVKASNTDAYDFFGQAVAIDGDTIVVGAWGEDSNANKINGNQSSNDAPNSGAVYVFVNDNGTWHQQAYLKASNSEAEDYFGETVAVSGNTIAIGVSHESSNARIVNGDQSNNSSIGAGAVYVFVRNNGVWSQQAYLKASNSEEYDGFGTSIAIDGDTIVVGATGEDSNSIGVNGNQDDNSSPNSGAAYIFVRTGSTWSQQAYLKPLSTATSQSFGRLFGSHVAISGDTIAVGSNGKVHIFDRSGSIWAVSSSLVSSNPNTALNGGIAIEENTLAVGAPEESAYKGIVEIFTRSGTTWVEQARLTQPTSFLTFGFTLAFSGDNLIIGGGSARIYTLRNNVWELEQILSPSNNGLGFGQSVAISGNWAIVGAPLEQSNATGINGDQSDQSVIGAGAAYIYTSTSAPTPTCAGLIQEAETSDAILAGFTVANDSAASGGSYIGAASGGNYYSGPNSSFKAEYCFNVPTAGTYRIKGKVHAADNFSDSFYVTVDGAPTTGYLWDVLQNSVYATDYVNDRNQADPVEVQLSAGPHYVTVYLREQGTRLDTLALEQVTAPPEPTCAGLVQEAENGVVIGNWGIGNDAAASGGAYIHAPNGSGDFWNGANGSQKASYCFNVATAGTYRIRGKVYGADTLSDSFYVQVDGAPTSGYLWDVLGNTTYTSDYVNDRNVADPVEVQLSAGQHLVNLFVREDGTRLDTIELQLVNSGPPPTPTCAGLTQEAEDGAVTGNFVIGSDAAASGGAYIHTPSGSGDFWNGPNASHKAEFCFNVPTAGTYRIDGKVYGADNLSDSFYVQVDGAPTSGYLWDVLPNTSYQLDSVSDRNQADPVLVPLSSGQHTVTLYAREAGTRLDTIQLVASTGSATDPQSRTLPFLAQGVGGTVHLDATGLNREVDFSTFTLTLLDAETQGQIFRQQVYADRFGTYHFDGMEPGQYVVQLAVPDDMVAELAEATITATTAEPVEVDFTVTANRKTYLPLLNR